MLYNDYIKTLSEKFERRLEDMATDYNFDLGPEFEIGICQILRDFLPIKFGICRGHVVNRNGEKAGDDIIIYDQERFPTLRINKRNDFSRKENIPVEAVYAYIEAKHKLTPETLAKAVSQIKTVKEICNTREKMGLYQHDPYIARKDNYTENDLVPNYRNPIYTLILSRYIEDGKKSSEPENIKSFFIMAMNNLTKDKNLLLPEVIVANRNMIASPFYISNLNNEHILSTFYIENKNYGIMAYPATDFAFGLALAKLAYVLDWIRLGKMPWDDMVKEMTIISNEIIKNDN